jgi:hypothetical protein
MQAAHWAPVPVLVGVAVAVSRLPLQTLPLLQQQRQPWLQPLPPLA